MKPTAEEMKNGWDEKSLTAYLAERQREEDEVFNTKKPKRQTRTVYRRKRNG